MKIRRKLRGGGGGGAYLQFLPISLTNCPGLLNLISKNAMRQAFYSLFRYADYLINIFRNINENIVKSEKITYI